MAKYGIPYKGSKSKIAEELLDHLPSGKRLVDLFGGGFAISQCAMEKYPDKWESVLYNDKNPLLPPLIRDAIAGKYSYENYDPKWISREEFFERKESDGYVKWIWSFGNNGNDYLFSRQIEDCKRQVHEYVVHGIKPDFEVPELTAEGIHERRMEWRQKLREQGARGDLQRLQQLEQLGRLQQLERLEQLEITCMDYRDYEWQDGDVVYCDIPYEQSAAKDFDYGGGFDHKAFYEWAESRPYPVFYSSYGPRVVWQKEVRSVMNSGKGAVRRLEGLYVAGNPS